MEPLTLHEYHISGNCYKIRLTASLLGIQFAKLVEYDVFNNETRTEHYLKNVNANGKIPVLQIGQDKFLPESNAACYYVATGSNLIPTDRLQHAEMLRWMFFEQYSHEPNVATLRVWNNLKGLDNLTAEQKALVPSKRKAGEAALEIMDAHLKDKPYFVAETITLADIALYAYTHLAEDGGFDLGRYPHISAWLKRIAQLPGYITLTE